MEIMVDVEQKECDRASLASRLLDSLAAILRRRCPLKKSP
jgi:hypothetical protein